MNVRTRVTARIRAPMTRIMTKIVRGNRLDLRTTFRQSLMIWFLRFIPVTFPLTQVTSDQSHGEDVLFHRRRDGGSPRPRFRLRSVVRSSSCEITEKGSEVRKRKRKSKGNVLVHIRPSLNTVVISSVLEASLMSSSKASAIGFLDWSTIMMHIAKSLSCTDRNIQFKLLAST
ncbi:unnamed protein product [Eruca vesicaria subsp. sativa]|uniref:Uncharacterized protein n=1 Tax=Eruca vesicaria subsp. sativa TaxID=29727 RepID=A0ABC8JFW9_ERUVS|nr:unnamed protein product [Eruca vesicaria subsp. sativa]